MFSANVKCYILSEFCPMRKELVCMNYIDEVLCHLWGCYVIKVFQVRAQLFSGSNFETSQGLMMFQ